MIFFKNLLIRKNWIGPQQIAVVCLVIAAVAAPFMIRNLFSKNKRQENRDYRYVRVPADYQKPKRNAEEGGPSYYLIWAIVLLFGGLIGTIALFAMGLDLVWIILPILVILAGIICLFINFKFKR